MIMKIAGGILIIGTTSIGGEAAAEKIKTQYGQMRYLQRFLCKLRSEICYARSYLGEAFCQIGQSEKSPYREWLFGMSGQMEMRKGSSFMEVWEEQTRNHLKDSGLSKEALDRLVSFGSQLGAADVTMQVKALDLYQEELEHSMEEMRKEMKEKIRLCRCMGIMGGIFLTVLLL